jgi:hypothetical protein
MSAYIKLSNSAYPRYIGDIEIDSAGMADYAHVEWHDQPAFNEVTERCYETAPVQENGVWHMVWAVRFLNEQEIDVINNPPPRFPWIEATLKD